MLVFTGFHNLNLWTSYAYISFPPLFLPVGPRRIPKSDMILNCNPGALLKTWKTNRKEEKTSI